MVRILISISVILLLAVACKKGNPVEEQSFGYLELHMIDLPGSQPLEVYMENIRLKDSLAASYPVLYPTQMVLAGKPTKVAFRKKGSDAILLDTTVILKSGQKDTLRLAFSEDFGMKRFLQSKGVGEDSVALQFYNALPTEIQADTMQINAELYRIHPVTGDFEQLTTFENYARLKLHPQKVVLPLRENGVELTYFLMFRNVRTGVYLMDLSGDLVGLGSFAPGKEHIINVGADKIDFGNNQVLYFFSAIPIEL